MPLAFLSGALQHWKLALGLFMAAYIGLLHLQLAGEKIHSAKVETRLRESNAAFAKLEADTRAKTALAQAQDAAHAAATEARDLKKAMETNDALRKDIAAVRSRLAERVRGSGAATTIAGSGGGSAVPSSAGSTPSLAGAGGGAFIPTDDLRICAENTLKAKAARDFLKGMRPNG